MKKILLIILLLGTILISSCSKFQTSNNKETYADIIPINKNEFNLDALQSLKSKVGISTSDKINTSIPITKDWVCEHICNVVREVEFYGVMYSEETGLLACFCYSENGTLLHSYIGGPED